MKRKAFCLALAAAVAVGLLSCGNEKGHREDDQQSQWDTSQEDHIFEGIDKEQILEQENLSDSVIFPLGTLNQSEHFEGETWTELLAGFDEELNYVVGNVTFEPGARNSWHTHQGGQVLLVTGGEGYHQIQGEAVELIRSGDVLVCPPGVTHWHGATADSWLVHIAITSGEVEWLAPLPSEVYDGLPNLQE